MHQSKVPEPAVSYFARFGVVEHPIIGQVYHPDRGWYAHPLHKRVSGSEIRRLRHAGNTHVRLDAGGHLADFQLREFSTEYVGLGPVFSYAELGSR